MWFAQNKISDSRRRIREALAETISIQHIILISLQRYNNAIDTNI